jgi:hypothetical protein
MAIAALARARREGRATLWFASQKTYQSRIAANPCAGRGTAERFVLSIKSLSAKCDGIRIFQNRLEIATPRIAVCARAGGFAWKPR